MKVLLIHGLLAWLGLCYQNIVMYIGVDPETSAGFQISAYPDLLLDTTIISPKDFSCTEVNSCTFEPTIKKMNYMGTELKYYEAYTQLNVIKQPFPDKYNFRYLVRDDNHFGSVVGVNRNSTYLAYLYKEDKQMGYTIILRLGWNNTLTYKLGVSTAAFSPGTTSSTTNRPSIKRLQTKASSYSSFTLRAALTSAEWTSRLKTS